MNFVVSFFPNPFIPFLGMRLTSIGGMENGNFGDQLFKMGSDHPWNTVAMKRPEVVQMTILAITGVPSIPTIKREQLDQTLDSTSNGALMKLVIQEDVLDFPTLGQMDISDTIGSPDLNVLNRTLMTVLAKNFGKLLKNTLTITNNG